MDFEYELKDERLVRTVIRSLMRKYNIFSVDEEDLFQEGAVGLLKAKMTYKAQSKAKFETYASTVVRNHVLDYLREQNKEPIPPEGSTVPGKVDPDPALWEILNRVLKEHCDPLERSIFNAYYKGYSYQEICEIFEINKKKVDNTIQKILKLARSIYKN